MKGVDQLFVNPCPKKEDIASSAKHALILPYIEIWV
jgi:hypothetical protein